MSTCGQLGHQRLPPSTLPMKLKLATAVQTSVKCLKKLSKNRGQLPTALVSKHVLVKILSPAKRAAFGYSWLLNSQKCYTATR